MTDGYVYKTVALLYLLNPDVQFGAPWSIELARRTANPA
jgi:hypothetical protein